MSVQDFVEKKGSLGILATLHRQEKLQFTPMKDEVGIAPKTLQKRLDEALDLNLIQLDRAAQGDRQASTEDTLGQNRVQVYKLTKRGFRVSREMATRGIVSDFHEMRMLQQRIEDERDKLVEWINANKSELAMIEEEFETPQKEFESIQESRVDSEDSDDEDSSPPSSPNF